MNIDITALFVCLADFCHLYEMTVEKNALPLQTQRKREGILSLSEMMLIEVLYHFSGYKAFKYFYLYHVCGSLRSLFRALPSYPRFVSIKKKLFLPLVILIHSIKGEKTGIYFADSTSLNVCKNKRIQKHQVFRGLAKRGKTTMGWFFGLKLHLAINQKGEIMGVTLTSGNIDDRSVLPVITEGLKGKCYADRGYIGKTIFHKLWEKGLHLITGIRRNMKNHLFPSIDKLWLRKRFLIETVFGVLKTDFNLEHTRHRSPSNAIVHILACVFAYIYKSNKPSIKTSFAISYP